MYKAILYIAVAYLGLYLTIVTRYTFSLISSKRNTFQLKFATGYEKKIWAFLWYQNLQASPKVWKALKDGEKRGKKPNGFLYKSLSLLYLFSWINLASARSNHDRNILETLDCWRCILGRPRYSIQDFSRFRLGNCTWKSADQNKHELVSKCAWVWRAWSSTYRSRYGKKRVIFGGKAVNISVASFPYCNYCVEGAEFGRVNNIVMTN